MVFSASDEVPETLYEDAFSAEDHFYHQYAHEADRVKSRGHHVAWGWRQFFKRAQPPASSGRLLDIGCSTGVFLSEAKKRGWPNVAGIEVSPSAAQRARSLVGCEIWEQPIESAAIDPGSIDAVTGWEIVEHVPNPRGFVRRIAELLCPGGCISLTTPNWESPWERSTTDFFRMPPYHLSYWTPTTLTRLLRDGGFTDVVTVRKPVAWKEELGLSAPLQLPLSILRSVLLDQKGNRLFVIGRRAR